MNLPKVCSITLLVLILVGFAAVAQATDVYGQVRICDGTCYGGIGMDGVTVLLYDIAHTVEYSTVTVTDEAFQLQHNLESPMGIYYFDNIPYREDYVVEVIEPIGVTTAVDPSQGSWWNANPREIGTSFYRCFLMDLGSGNFEPRTIGFWKHQANVSVKGKGNAQVPPEEFAALLDLVFEHFDGADNFPIDGVSSVVGNALTDQDALNTFKLSNGGSAGMVNKAKKQLLALLLNVVAEYVYEWDVISEDDRTVSEAISFGADMITNSGAAIETAKDAMDYINNGITVPAGWIPEYGMIYYGNISETIANNLDLPDNLVLMSNYPNPFNPETTISFNLPQAGNITLSIYNLQGQLVEELLTGNQEAGLHGITWNAAGYPSGTYIYSLSNDMGNTTGKMLLLK
ncbi:hypothetical protein CEE37_14305 [candidate division LCP-89 bacterium B3_LCP]|uniref:Secretion system C-terminal sorting domain-containing protein n=1 Tax=candidate division LCP-89 bacterium B3_LCP TaxID=2012998 RepID=A0A532UQR3_UNCL8|nr:MAG: hypothetical protein CEE37_14305 [candidate division LCP-89 bacterium B3_LCP]